MKWCYNHRSLVVFVKGSDCQTDCLIRCAHVLYMQGNDFFIMVQIVAVFRLLISSHIRVGRVCQDF